MAIDFPDLAKRAGYTEIIPFANMFDDTQVYHFERLARTHMKPDPRNFLDDIMVKFEGLEKKYAAMGNMDGHHFFMNGKVNSKQPLQSKILEDLEFYYHPKNPVHWHGFIPHLAFPFKMGHVAMRYSVQRVLGENTLYNGFAISKLQREAHIYC